MFHFIYFVVDKTEFDFLIMKDYGREGDLNKMCYCAFNYLEETNDFELVSRKFIKSTFTPLVENSIKYDVVVDALGVMDEEELKAEGWENDWPLFKIDKSLFELTPDTEWET